MTIKQRANKTLDTVKEKVAHYRSQIKRVGNDAYLSGYNYEGELPFGSSVVAGIRYSKGIADKKNYNKIQSRVVKAKGKNYAK